MLTDCLLAVMPSGARAECRTQDDIDRARFFGATSFIRETRRDGHLVSWNTLIVLEWSERRWN